MKTATLEQSKRIQELGVEIKTHWNWAYLYFETDQKEWGLIPAIPHTNKRKEMSAPTAEEMLDRMPKYLHDSHFILTIEFQDNEYVVFYKGLEEQDTKNKSLSEAVGDMFIWLGENNHLTKPNSSKPKG